MINEVKAAAQGHWRHVLNELGIDVGRLGTNKPCLMCGGTDRASFTDKDGHGTYFCRQCGPKDGLDLLMALNGWDWKQACREVERVLGIIPEPTRVTDRRDPLRAMRAVLRSSTPAREGGHAHRYLKGRGLSVLPPGLFEHDGLLISGTPYPAVIAPVQAVSRALVSLHQTFIEGDGKAPVAIQKYVMRPETTINGGAVRLWAPAETLGLAEGIESSVAAHQLFNLPVWACLSAHGLEVVQLPEMVRNVVVFADEDSLTEFAGQRAAFNAAARFAKEGRKVSVKVAPIPGTDWLDELNLRQGRFAA